MWIPGLSFISAERSREPFDETDQTAAIDVADSRGRRQERGLNVAPCPDIGEIPRGAPPGARQRLYASLPQLLRTRSTRRLTDLATQWDATLAEPAGLEFDKEPLRQISRRSLILTVCFNHEKPAPDDADRGREGAGVTDNRRLPSTSSRRCARIDR